MKHLFTLLLTAITYTGFTQISPPAVPKAGTKQATTNQAFIYRSLTGDTTRYYLRIGASGIPADYFEISNGAGGGGGTVTSVTSANSDISVANTTTTPVLTLNSGYSSGQVTKFSTAPSSGIRLAWDSGLNNSIYTNPSTRYFYYDAGTTTYGGHVFLVNSGQEALRLGTNSYATFPRLSTSLTAPSIVGTPKMVITDANGTLSWDNIPSASGTVTSFSKTDGIGIISSVTNSTTTPNHTIRVDTTVIASKSYVDTLAKYTTNRILKDFLIDSIVTNNTGTPKILYMDTLKANQLSKNGDKIHMKISGYMTASINADQYIYVRFGGTDRVLLTLTPPLTGTSFSWVVDATFMRINSTEMKIISVSMLEDGAPSNRVKTTGVSSLNFTTTNDIGIRASQSGGSVGSLTAQMGYIEYKPAAL